jgi:hypothetical protein
MFNLHGSCLSKGRPPHLLYTSGDPNEPSLPPKKRKTVTTSSPNDEIDSKDTCTTSSSSSDDREQDRMCSGRITDSEESSASGPLVTCLRTHSNSHEMRKRQTVHFADDVKLLPSMKKKSRRVIKKRKSLKKKLPEKKDEEVKVIVLHTGILYVHKGSRPWVEFVRKR